MITARDTLFAVFALAALFLTSSVCMSAPYCTPITQCAGLWVAAQDIGVSGSFFDLDNKRVPADKIVKGMRLTANRDIRVHSELGKLSNNPFDIKDKTKLSVLDVKVVGTTAGSQIWIQIGDTPLDQQGTSTGPATCDPIAKCEDLWVAGQNIGESNSLFLFNKTILAADQIHLGMPVEANDEINVRNSPTDWSGIPFRLKKGSLIFVKEIKSKPYNNGTQLWFRIGNPFLSQAPMCAPLARCIGLWVDANKIGATTTPFSVGSNPLNLSDIKIGKVIQAAESLNVRASPDKTENIQFLLPKDSSLIVKDLRSIATTDGTLSWIKIGEPPSSGPSQLPPQTAATAPACEPIAKCEGLWVAGQNIGELNSLFSANKTTLRANEIHTGMPIEANDNINVRSSPADWVSAPFFLKKGAQVVVKELKFKPYKDGAQLWIKVGDPYLSQAPMCAPITQCVDLWVAANKQGMQTSLFAVDSHTLNLSDIKVGTLIRPTDVLPVRASPDNAENVRFLLPKDTSLLVKDLRSIASSGGPQIWVRIGEPASGQVPPVVVSGPPSAAVCFHENEQIQFAPPGEAYNRGGLIMHDNSDFGDTAQREGWYWLGVWIRSNRLHQPWVDSPARQLSSFDAVIGKLEPNQDGIFVRAPGKDPFGRATDGNENHGTTRDQLVPLVAAMRVWGKQAELQRLWEALPEDILGKHDFQGHWHDAVTGEDSYLSDPCANIKNRDCSQKDTNCSRQSVCGGVCPCEVRGCDSDCPSKCHTECPCGTCGNFNCRVEVFGATQCPCGQCGDMNCRAEVCLPDLDCSAKKLDCERLKTQEAVACQGAESACELGKIGKQKKCEIDRGLDTATCEAAKGTGVLRFTGDPFPPAMYNLFIRAGVVPTAKFPVTQFAVSAFDVGDLWLKGGIDILRNQATGDMKCGSQAVPDPLDCVDQDMNSIAMLWTARDTMTTPISSMAIASYRSRAHSYGSYFGKYCETYGPLVTSNQCDKGCLDRQLLNRMKAGIANGWEPDGPGFGPYGAVRWYNRWSTGANPGLSVLWKPIIEDLVK